MHKKGRVEKTIFWCRETSWKKTILESMFKKQWWITSKIIKNPRIFASDCSHGTKKCFSQLDLFRAWPARVLSYLWSTKTSSGTASAKKLYTMLVRDPPPLRTVFQYPCSHNYRGSYPTRSPKSEFDRKFLLRSSAFFVLTSPVNQCFGGPKSPNFRPAALKNLNLRGQESDKKNRWY